MAKPVGDEPMVLNCERCADPVWEGPDSEADEAQRELENEEGEILCEDCADTTPGPGDEGEMEEHLVQLLSGIRMGEDAETIVGEFPTPARVETFADAGVLTGNKGLVLSFRDNSGGEVEYQITIVRSR